MVERTMYLTSVAAAAMTSAAMAKGARCRVYGLVVPVVVEFESGSRQCKGSGDDTLSLPQLHRKQLHRKWLSKSSEHANHRSGPAEKCRHRRLR
mmetsp:Transcript_18925/g.39709  ORF Transcript_18925/g.39709 Transcript_18925/m.39709 type:complete len:94 (+) Transcript_18925:512-793(+)